MAGLVPAIHVLLPDTKRKTWTPAYAGMTTLRLSFWGAANKVSEPAHFPNPFTSATKARTSGSTCGSAALASAAVIPGRMRGS
jgi:hypothetical protein